MMLIDRSLIQPNYNLIRIRYRGTGDLPQRSLSSMAVNNINTNSKSNERAK